MLETKSNLVPKADIVSDALPYVLYDVSNVVSNIVFNVAIFN